MDHSLAREAMFYAGRLGMNDGNFAFVMFALDLDVVRTNSKSPSRWFMGQYGPETEVADDATREAFDSVLLLATKVPDSVEYATFSNEVKRGTSGSPFFSDVYQGFTKSPSGNTSNFDLEVCWCKTHEIFDLGQNDPSPIIPSASRSSRHFIVHRKCVCFE